MFAAGVPLFPEQASTVAGRVDALFFFILLVCGFFGLLIALLVFYLSVRYRRRSPDERPPQYEASHRLELVWTVVPLMLTMVMYAWGASIFFSISRPPTDAEEVYVVGRQWMWKIQHLNGQREINELHVPIGRPVRLKMISEDVIHNFGIPAFRTKMDVLPGRYTTQWFEATRVGSFDFFCDQYCGTGHSQMIGKITVMDPADFQDWLSGQAEGSMALQGRKLFLKLRCITCHSANARARAPLLEGLYRQPVAMRDGSQVIVDDAYIRESILNPASKVVAGFDSIMPTFKGQVNEEQLLQLIAFIKSLDRGETPIRNERTEPPVATQGKSPQTSSKARR